jgi:lipopolysaccharide/colanic/teichoic acid biosynthesis glycosyltransferase
MASLRVNSVPTKSSGLTGSRLPIWKRSIDIACSCAALPVLAVATFFLAMLMSIGSKGPIFFRQERIGYMGRRFRLYKFRTMHVGADTAGHQAHFAELMASNAPMQKLDAQGDSRLIPCGWLIRACGLDELPQIINVLKGDMSLVGPRPCIPYEYERYSPLQRTRCHTAPGLTGLWQVSGKNHTTFDRMIQLDIQYATERSLKLDLTIFLKTVPVVASQVAEMCRRRLNARRTATAAGREALRSAESQPERTLSSSSSAPHRQRI